MGYDFRYDVRDGIATLTFDHPYVLNALSFDLYAQPSASPADR
jgi:enoyl-CoA hydratase/carnithine racemase